MLSNSVLVLPNCYPLTLVTLQLEKKNTFGYVYFNHNAKMWLYEIGFVSLLLNVTFVRWKV